MTTTPPGWYDDGSGSLRWWDGTAWTEHVQVPAGPAPASYAPASQGATGVAALGLTAQDAATGVEAPERPAKSTAWVIWLIIGILVLAVVIALVVIIPLFLSLVRGVGAGGSVEGSTPDEKEAVAAVLRYDEALATADCELFFSATTEAFRADVGIEECADFEQLAFFVAEATDDYAMTITGVETDAEAIVVTTNETYTLLLDGDGNPLDAPEPSSDDYEYTVVSDGSAWLVDDLD